jgi:hypothetical protein
MSVANITELKSFTKPPELVDMTCQSLMILLKVPAKDLNWTNWKKVAAKP